MDWHIKINTICIVTLYLTVKIPAENQKSLAEANKILKARDKISCIRYKYKILLDSMILQRLWKTKQSEFGLKNF